MKTLSWPDPAPGESAVDLDPQVKLFVFKYLNPQMQPRLANAWEELNRQAGQLDWDIVGEMIRRMDYPPDGVIDYPRTRPDSSAYDSWFMGTAYWKIVAEQVKKRDGYCCRRCKRTRYLETHHLHYRNHGDEHLCLDDLLTLCSVCHCLVHDLPIKAVLAEWNCLKEAGLVSPLVGLKFALDGFADQTLPAREIPEADPKLHNFGRMVQ